VFGENQWREVASRLDTWRESLTGVLAVIRREREQLIEQKAMELREIEGRLNGGRGGGMVRGRVDIDAGAD
jgi:translation initiation factor 3 subunit M